LANNQNWGTYSNFTYTINGIYSTENKSWLDNNSISHSTNDSTCIYHGSGLNINGYKKNIADLGGNIFEYVGEKENQSTNKPVFRGGQAYYSSIQYPASRRIIPGIKYSGQGLGFRVVLYIQDEPQKEYVTDGLLAYYDAENNTGTGHSFTATTWKDLSGNNNDATLSGFDGTDASGWHSNYLAFDGVNDYVTGALNSNGDITVEFIAKKNNSDTATMYMFNPWGANVNEPTLQAWAKNNTSLAHRVLVPPTNTSLYIEYGSHLGSASFSTIASSVITKSSTSIKSFNNGNYLREITDTAFIERFNITDINFTIGKWHNYNSYFSNQNVYAMRVYNRALTEDEIRQNYEIDKVRFNIQE
jgi:hypothetical protein